MNVITNNSIRCTIALAALEQVVDPEIGLNVVDLGLIYQLDFDEEHKKIFVTMTLTTQFCPMGESITAAVKRVMEHTFRGRKCGSNLVLIHHGAMNGFQRKGNNF